MNRLIIKKIVVEKEDFGGEYSHLPRYAEMEKPELPEIGKTYMVWEIDYVGPNQSQHPGYPKLAWSADEKMIEWGFPGNSDHNIRRFHGWRGTTDDYSVYALGVRICKKVERKDFIKTVHYTIIFGRDLEIENA